MPAFLIPILSMIGGLGTHSALRWLLTKLGTQAASKIPAIGSAAGKILLEKGLPIVGKGTPFTLGGLGSGAAELAGFTVGFPAGMYATESLLSPGRDTQVSPVTPSTRLSYGQEPVSGGTDLSALLSEYIGDESDLNELLARLSRGRVV